MPAFAMLSLTSAPSTPKPMTPPTVCPWAPNQIKRTPSAANDKPSDANDTHLAAKKLSFE